MKRLLLLLLLLYPLSAAAETYQWTDERGTVNFADDLGKVPKKFHKKAKRLGGDDGPSVTVVDEGQEPATQAKPAAKEAQPQKTLYDGKDEVTWRTDFHQAAVNLESAQSELDALKQRAADTSGMSRYEYLSIQSGIKQGEVRVQNLREKLEQLREAADRAGVPPHLRK